jgi:uncharacterized protein YcbK (DUF882 family)
MRDRTGAAKAAPGVKGPLEVPARRLAFKSAIGCAIAISMPAPAWARRLAVKAPGRELSLLNLHTGERLKAEYWRNGQYVPGALRAVSVVLRDHCNNKTHPIDPQLLDLIHLLHAKLGSAAPFNVISGYRSPETNALMHEASAGVAAHSLHMEGRAIDIRLPGTRLASVKRIALDMALGGVGYYPTDDFVHIDTGAVRRWGA